MAAAGASRRTTESEDRSTEASHASKASADGAYPEASAALHTGWLTKKAPGMLAKAQHRFFVLYGPPAREIHYFEDAHNYKAAGSKGHKGAIALAGVKPADVQRLKPGSSEYSFVIVTPQRRWQLKAETEAAFEGWRDAMLPVLGA